MRWSPLALVFALLVSASARADVPVPDLHARVTDLTGTLTADQTSSLEQKLAAFEQTKGSQIAVLMVSTTQSETIEQYGIRAGEAWKIGRKGVDDGAILLVAKNDHRLRIEVGYGLEGALNDATSKRIVSEIITPFFKQGQFYEGIDAGVEQMMKVIQGEPLPAPTRHARADGDWSGAIMMLLIAAFVIGPFFRALFGRPLGAGLSGGLAAVAAYLLTGLLAAALIAALIGVVAVLIGVGRGGWTSGGTPWYGGGFGTGGGGFSGGGGGFGGGGASGSW